MLTKKDITKCFTNIGVTPGDILVLQSSYKGCGEIEDGPDGLINALMELLGKEGTLIMPAYNLSMWTEQRYFDIIETPSKAGIITEIFRKREDVGRTAHPIYSLSVWGRLKDELESLTCSWWEHSVFAHLLIYDALYVTIGLGHKTSFVSAPLTEFLMKVPYRRIKCFGGIYLNRDRYASIRDYRWNILINQNQDDLLLQAHIYMIEKGMVKSYSHNDVPFCYVRAKDYHHSLTDYLTNAIR